MFETTEEDAMNFDLVMAVARKIEERLGGADSLDVLSEAEGDILAVVTADGVIGNGGFVYWYEGKTAADTLRVAAAFDRIGLPKIAAVMKASLKPLPDNCAEFSWEEMQAYVYDHHDELANGYEDLEEEFYGTDFMAPIVQYVMRRRTELVQANPGIGEVVAHG